MPTVVENETIAYVFCLNGRCDGYKEREVPATETIVSTLYTDSDPSAIPGVEKSHVHVRPLDENDLTCPECNGPCGISPNPRPEYAKQSGQDPMEIFNLYDRTTGQLREMRQQNAADDVKREREMAELREQLAQQSEMVAALLADKEPVKRGPGRPPKVPDAD